MSSVLSTERRVLAAVWVGLAAWLAGRLVDARWHATHDEFEGTSQQIKAHWLAWLGVAVTLIVAIVAARQFAALRRSAGVRTLVAAGALYAIVGVWHFIEHANGANPDAAHVLLGLANAGMLVGAIVLTVSLRRGRSPAGRRTR
jgi:hypothetical protein